MIEDRCGQGSLTLSAKRGDLGRTPYFRSRILSKSTISGLRGHGQLEQCHRQWYSNSQVQQQVAPGWRPPRRQVASKSANFRTTLTWEMKKSPKLEARAGADDRVARVTTYPRLVSFSVGVRARGTHHFPTIIILFWRGWQIPAIESSGSFDVRFSISPGARPWAYLCLSPVEFCGDP